ncbi:hypothetical protein [Methylobacterium iners]|uniref:Ribosomal protein S27 n=1 Tax=Methylobacterium iners TaxID=418707 RepID=A0ABQ4RTC1_9HYPH|nr:hypothetical protein [Methylobacterium iners]GJD92913.1 hypothetical protein OCOJLMKI_0096 [Methylobacterium iners]
MQLVAVILVCAITTAPADCTRESALDVVVRPVAMPMECMSQGQALGASALDVRREDERYLMVRCEKRAS